jgi:hypothetical protein
MVSWQDSSSSTADSCTIYYKYLITTLDSNISSAIANFCLTADFTNICLLSAQRIGQWGSGAGGQYVCQSVGQ